MSIDWTIDAARQLQLFGSHQQTELETSTGSGAGTPLRVPLKLSTLQLGGTNFIDGRVGNGTYVVGGLGFTQLSPGLAGFESELRLSLSLGLGYQWPLSAGLSLRTELRGMGHIDQQRRLVPLFRRLHRFNQGRDADPGRSPARFGVELLTRARPAVCGALCIAQRCAGRIAALPRIVDDGGPSTNRSFCVKFSVHAILIIISAALIGGSRLRRRRPMLQPLRPRNRTLS